jgi:hypothetical protein
MPGAAYPKPEDQRVTRHEPKFGWVNLPTAGRCGAPPKLPAWRQWQSGTRGWWKALWAKPQATQWEQDGSTLHTLACLYDDLIAGRSEAAKVSAEMRQHEDRHGLNPKAMLQLRWRIVDEDAASQSGPASVSNISERRSRIKVT